MEFKFPVNDVFRQSIVQIGPSLLPPGFTGDRRAFWDTVGKVSEVVNAMGEASAAAQGLTKPITTAERLRNSEHNLYLLIDQNAANGRGAVTGMLKTGKKGLYVFDRNGQHYQVSPPCVLDFYIHESRQRTGLGKRLFEHMLQTESIEPVKMAIDRPSEKFLGFLNKHYSLNNPVKQMNNYVVFDGFFPSTPEKNGTVELDHSGTSPGKKQSANGLQTTSFASPLGRYGAPRPPCSMGQIIHNQTSTIPKSTEPTGVEGVRSAPVTNYQNFVTNSPRNTDMTHSAPNIHYQSQQPKIKFDGLSDKTVYEQDKTYQQQNEWQNHTGAKVQNPQNDYSSQQTAQNEHVPIVQPAVAATQNPSGIYYNGPPQNVYTLQQTPYAQHYPTQYATNYTHNPNVQNVDAQQMIPNIQYAPHNRIQLRSDKTLNVPQQNNYELGNLQQSAPVIPCSQNYENVPQNATQYSGNPHQINDQLHQQPILQTNVQYSYSGPNDVPATNYEQTVEPNLQMQQNVPLNYLNSSAYDSVAYAANITQSAPNITQSYYSAGVVPNVVASPEISPQLNSHNVRYPANTLQIVPNMHAPPPYYNTTINQQLPNAFTTEVVPQISSNVVPQQQSQNIVQPIQSQPNMNQNQNVQMQMAKQSMSQPDTTVDPNVVTNTQNLNVSKYTLPHQPIQTQYQSIDPQVQEHIEGNQLSSQTNEPIPQAQVHCTTGDTEVVVESNAVATDYGYPSQVPNPPLKQTVTT